MLVFFCWVEWFGLVFFLVWVVVIGEDVLVVLFNVFLYFCLVYFVEVEFVVFGFLLFVFRFCVFDLLGLFFLVSWWF